MGLDTTLNLITTVTVIAGVTFAVFEVLHMSARRRQNAAFALVQSYQTPEFAKAIVKVATIPDGLSRRQLEEHLKEDIDSVYRAKLDRETYFEWFQWLAERIDERESVRPAVPAQIEHSAWKT
jgi:uncharacterized protein (DUF2336 family)